MPKRTLLLLVHLLGWLFFYSTILSFLSLAISGDHFLSSLLSFHFIYFLLLFPIIFYANLLVFTPRFFIRQNYLLYLGVFLLFLLLILQTQPFDHIMGAFRPGGPAADHGPSFPPPKRQNRLDIISLILFLFCWVLSTAIPIASAWRASEAKARKAEQEKTQAELSFLKAQIHPHFLFNTLNNLYSMALSSNQALPASILQLSNIMRYVTDEVKHDFVPLEQEIECIRDYIDLQKLRLSNTTIVNVTVNGDITRKKIAPLILMTFIENVFKYGVSKHENSTIDIRIESDRDSIRFSSKNRVFEGTSHLERTGIGIENTKRRLNYLYPDRHLLNLSDKDEYFNVQLILADKL